MKILLVEDNETQRVMAQQLLNSDHRVTTVLDTTDGKKALDIVEGNQDLDLIISDIELESMDAPTMVRGLSELGCTIPIAFITAHGPDLLTFVEDAAQEEGIKVIGTLEKPMSAAKIASLLEKI